MKTIITMIVVAVILSFVAGCGPDQPFEIKSLSGIGASVYSVFK